MGQAARPSPRVAIQAAAHLPIAAAHLPIAAGRFRSPPPISCSASDRGPFPIAAGRFRSPPPISCSPPIAAHLRSPPVASDRRRHLLLASDRGPSPGRGHLPGRPPSPESPPARLIASGRRGGVERCGGQTNHLPGKRATPVAEWSVAVGRRIICPGTCHRRSRSGALRWADESSAPGSAPRGVAEWTLRWAAESSARETCHRESRSGRCGGVTPVREELRQLFLLPPRPSCKEMARISSHWRASLSCGGCCGDPIPAARRCASWTSVADQRDDCAARLPGRRRRPSRSGSPVAASAAGTKLLERLVARLQLRHLEIAQEQRPIYARSSWRTLRAVNRPASRRPRRSGRLLAS